MAEIVALPFLLREPKIVCCFAAPFGPFDSDNFVTVPTCAADTNAVTFRRAKSAIHLCVVSDYFLLDLNTTMVHKLMRDKFSISETARLLGVDRGTLRRWIKNGLIPHPFAEDVAGTKLRYWDKDGFATVKEHKNKHFGEGKGKRNDLREKKAKRT